MPDDETNPKGIYRIREDGTVTEAVRKFESGWRHSYFAMSPTERLAVCSRSVDRLPAGPPLQPTAAGTQHIVRILTRPHPDEPDFRQLVISYGRRQVFEILRNLVEAKALDADSEIRVVAIAEDVFENLDGTYDQGVRWIPRWMARSAKITMEGSMDSFGV